MNDDLILLVHGVSEFLRNVSLLTEIGLKTYEDVLLEEGGTLESELFKINRNFCWIKKDISYLKGQDSKLKPNYPNKDFLYKIKSEMEKNDREREVVLWLEENLIEMNQVFDAYMAFHKISINKGIQ